VEKLRFDQDGAVRVLVVIHKLIRIMFALAILALATPVAAEVFLFPGPTTPGALGNRTVSSAACLARATHGCTSAIMLVSYSPSDSIALFPNNYAFDSTKQVLDATGAAVSAAWPPPLSGWTGSTLDGHYAIANCVGWTVGDSCRSGAIGGSVLSTRTCDALHSTTCVCVGASDVRVTPSPTFAPVTSAPSTRKPTGSPVTSRPSKSPSTSAPSTGTPTRGPVPTNAPTKRPSIAPTTHAPSSAPRTASPSHSPSKTPTHASRTPGIYVYLYSDTPGSGNMGGVAAANAVCASRRGVLPGTSSALVVETSTLSIANFPSSKGFGASLPIRVGVGAWPQIAANWSVFVSGTPSASPSPQPLSFEGTGLVQQAYSSFFVGTSARSCSDWTAAPDPNYDPNGSVIVGRTDTQDSSRWSMGMGSCLGPAYALCISW
jgi:hypothetical protein